MKLAELKNALPLALKNDEAAIGAHVSRLQKSNRSGGIESKFAKCFERHLPAKPKNEIAPADLGLEQHYEGRQLGRLDCYVESTEVRNRIQGCPNS